MIFRFLGSGGDVSVIGLVLMASFNDLYFYLGLNR